ncbi:MAG: FAD-binding protein [Myxococcota bacterium]|nr:FAD-binding protein [Myxococcota bacterium]
MSPPKITRKDALPWTNFAASLAPRKIATLFQLESCGDPRADADALRGIVVEAEGRSPPSSVRAVGTSWSFSPVMLDPGVMIDMTGLDRVLPALGAGDLAPGVDPSALVHVQAGARIADVNDALARAGRSMRTMGGRGGQTIGGAIATGSHGSAIDLRAPSDFVRGLHLVTSGGRSIWIERKSRPAVTPAWCVGQVMEYVADDDAFEGAVVGLGCWGVVASLLVETEPLFHLELRRFRSRLDTCLRRAIRTLELDRGALLHRDDRPYHFEVVLDPYHATDEGGATITAAWKTDAPRAGDPARGNAVSDALGDFLTALAGLKPGAVPAMLPLLLGAQYGERTFTGPLGDCFPANVPSGFSPFAMEVAVDLADAEAALDVVLAQIRAPGSYQYPGVVALRFTRGTGALLGHTRFDRTCTIELPTLGGIPGTDAFFDRLREALDRAGIEHCQHFGQANDYSWRRTSESFGDRLARWQKARTALLGAGAATFSSPTSRRWGLTT